MMPKATIDFEDDTLCNLDILANMVSKGNRTKIVNALIKAAVEENVKIPVVSREATLPAHYCTIQEILSYPKIDLSLLNFDAKGATPAFRDNLYNLDLPYRVAVFQLLYQLTNGKSVNQDINKNQMQLGVTKNVAVYYFDPKEDGYFRAFYMVIAGQMGNYTIPEWLDSMGIKEYRKSQQDPDSPIWISNKERFTADRFSTKAGQKFFKEMLEVLGFRKNLIAAQLSVKDLNILVEYFNEKMPVSK